MSKSFNLTNSILIWVFIGLIYTIVFSFIENENSIVGGFNNKDNLIDVLATTKAIILALFTIVGIWSKMLFEEIENTDAVKFKLKESIKKVRTSKHTWLTLLICPAIIGSFYESLKTVDNLLLIGMFAYQNGFFFRAVLGKKETKKIPNE